MTSEGVQQSIFTYEVSPSESLSEGVVTAVAAASGADPIAPKDSTGTAAVLEPLYTVVDPDALDALFRNSDADPTPSAVRVTFTYHDHEVTVSGDERIEVERRTTTGEASD